MKLRKRIKKIVDRKILSSQVQKITTPAAPGQTLDGLDRDVLAHVNHFFRTPLPTMEKFSLLTPEDATAALAAIERTQRLLEERMRTVRVLKALCEHAKKNENQV